MRADVCAIARGAGYGDCEQPNTLADFLLRAHYTFPDKPIWLTEFSCMYGDAALNARFLQVALPILYGARGVERFAWFADRYYTGGELYRGVSLVDGYGRLTVVGDVFRSRSERYADESLDALLVEASDADRYVLSHMDHHGALWT
jgi:hypothetical protein